MEDNLLRVQEVSAAIRCSRSFIYQQMTLGKFPKSIKLGERAVRWRKSDIEKWIEERACH